MKKMKFVVLIAAVLCFGMVIVKSKEGEINDNYVHYIYWDRYDWNVFYTGVTNKLHYQTYRPCVGIPNSEYRCGERAAFSEYREYGLSVAEGYSHIHALENGDYYFDYIVN